MPTRRGSQDRRKERAERSVAPRKNAPRAESKPAATVKAPRVTSEPTPQGKVPRRNALFPIGVNYYPLDAETQSWDDWYTEDVAADFARIAEARFTIVRLFVSWKVLEPQVGQYNEDGLDRLQDVIDAARTNKLQVILCFFADDRLSELMDVPWGKKRNPHTDSYLIQREVALVQKIVSRFRADSAIFAWDLANEAFCTGFESATTLQEWVSTMREAVREVDTERPVIVSVDPETLYRHTGVDPRAAIDTCEFAVSHSTAPYRAYSSEGPISSGPSTYLDSFLLRSAARDLPVLADDIGVFGLEYSAAEEAAHVRTGLYSAFINRAAGAVLRRFRDLDTERREPYFRDPFEVLVGINDINGEPKPAFDEVMAFARVAARIDLRRYTLIQERTAVMIPSERYEPLPNLAGLYDPRACLQAYIGAKQAHVPVTVARETDDFSAYSVLIIPSAFHLAEETWDRLAEFVQGGGSIVLSYGGGDAHRAVRDLFGVEFLGDGGGRESVTCRVAQADVLGSLRSFDATMETSNFALLGHGGATVVATDAKGSPLLTINQLGQGRAIYISFPIERALAQGDPWAAPSAVTGMLRTVYGAAASAAGCKAPVTCDVPEVEVALFQGEDDDVLVLLNHAPNKLTANITTDRTLSTIADVRGGSPVAVGGSEFGVPLDSNGTATLRLVYE